MSAALNDAEIEAEKVYRRTERLGILTEGARAPTPFELNLAMRESKEWETAWRASRLEDREP